MELGHIRLFLGQEFDSCPLAVKIYFESLFGQLGMKMVKYGDKMLI